MFVHLSGVRVPAPGITHTVNGGLILQQLSSRVRAVLNAVNVLRQPQLSRILHGNVQLGAFIKCKAVIAGKRLIPVPVYYQVVFVIIEIVVLPPVFPAVLFQGAVHVVQISRRTSNRVNSPVLPLGILQFNGHFIEVITDGGLGRRAAHGLHPLFPLRVLGHRALHTPCHLSYSFGNCPGLRSAKLR